MLRGKLLYPTITEEFFEERAFRIRSRATRVSYTETYQALQRRYPGKRVNEFSADHLVAYLTTDERGEPRRWATGTLRKQRTALCSLFAWTSQKGSTKPGIDGALRDRINPTVVPVRQRHWLRAEQVRALLDSCPTDDRGLRDRLIIHLCAFAGLRCAEAAGLRWDQLDLEARTLTMLGKGAKPAVVDLPAQLVEALLHWRAAYETGLGRPVTDEPLLCRFRGTGGGALGPKVMRPMWGVPVESRGVREAVALRARRAGLHGVRTHDLRRTFAGLLEERGVLLQDISALLRHSSVATTQRYLADSPGRRREVMASFVI